MKFESRSTILLACLVLIFEIALISGTRGAEAFLLSAFPTRSVAGNPHRNAFLLVSNDPHRNVVPPSGRIRMVSKELVNDEVLWAEEDDGDDYEGDDSGEDGDDMEASAAASAASKLKSPRWDSLNPKIKERIVKAGQERAIANKKKREPAQTKKRRMMMFMKDKQREKKRASKVKRPLSFKDRTPLKALVPGMEMTGVVISLTNFGAYVDVGTECDGLLHVSQFTQDFFVEHPRQVVTPGDEITVRVRSTSPELKKMQLTMLPEETLRAEMEDREDTEERITLEEIQVDDELWGEIKRVTDFGAYVDVGAVVPGFLHFMDHPAYGWPSNRGKHPSEYMTANERVRVWVSDVDTIRERLKLTANRPVHLPGPRRELPI